MQKSQNKWCFIPCCTSTSLSTPNKIFLCVPQDAPRKRKWFKAARRDMPKSESMFFCCEDHFKLEEDMENIVLNPGVVPHIFDCQTDRKRASTVPDRSLFAKRQRRQLVHEAVAESDRKQHNMLLMSPIDEPCASTSAQLPTPINEPCASTSAQLPGITETDCSYTTDDSSMPANVDSTEGPLQTRNVGLQAKPHFRSKHILCNITSRIKDSATSPVRSLFPKDASTSPIKMSTNVGRIILSQTNSSSSSDAEVKSSTSSFVPSSDSDYEGDNFPQDIKEEQLQTLNCTRLLVEKKPKKYTGIPDDLFPHVINLLSTHTNISKDNLNLTLMKIKLNHQFFILLDMFGMSVPNASKIFKRCLLKMVFHLRSFIFWPSQGKIKYHLPIPFRARYSNVHSIIDCFEIQIQKPIDPVKQALTWSEYKKCNTLKYLISSTPDGFINFISKGYGGRISDSLLVEDSGFLDLLPNGCSVMADRGFKDIAKQIHDRNCQLVRPPSVSSSVKPTKSEVLESKRIASLRIHIERVIRRLREFEYLKPHSVIDHNLVEHTDHIIEIACALINLQGPIIRQT